MMALSGPDNPMWKGGRTVDSDGYVLIRVGKDHHLADCRGYAYEHRLVAEEKLGRRLMLGEEVHHEDENRTNNDSSNLAVKATRAEHKVEHRGPGSKNRLPGEENPLVSCACGCGQMLRKFDAAGRLRRFVHGHFRRPKVYKRSVIACACGCGQLMEDYDAWGRKRRYISGHNAK